jgi:hypothetical protein
VRDAQLREAKSATGRNNSVVNGCGRRSTRVIHKPYSEASMPRFFNAKVLQWPWFSQTLLTLGADRQ